MTTRKRHLWRSCAVSMIQHTITSEQRVIGRSSAFARYRSRICRRSSGPLDSRLPASVSPADMSLHRPGQVPSMVALYSGKTDMMAAMGKRSTRVRETLAVLLFRHWAPCTAAQLRASLLCFRIVWLARRAQLSSRLNYLVSDRISQIASRELAKAVRQRHSCSV